MRTLGIDLGSKRVGIALSDSAGVLATPYEVLQRSSDRQRDHRTIKAMVEELGVEIVVVGLPLSLDGSIGPAAEGALAEVEELRIALGVPVETYDERLTTVTAERSLMEQNLNAKERRKVVDKVAATVLLQAWLEGPGAHP
ncbi:MAG: Holliday junction resolvase RuvX [Actinomycetia bacterium]|nr:Holliday junction resolvase RuvX [Actinomycetes bacterium]